MSTFIKAFFEIDYNTDRLIYLFNSGKFEFADYDELSLMISHLNEYQFLYLLDNIDLSIAYSKKHIGLFLLFVYEEKRPEEYHPIDYNDYISGINNSNSQLKTKMFLTDVSFKYRQTELPKFTAVKVEQGIIEILEFKSMRIKKNMLLVKSIREKLNKLKLDEYASESTYLEHSFIYKGEMGIESGKYGHFEYKDISSNYNKIDVIRNGFYFNFDFMYYSVSNTKSQQLLKSLSNKLRAFNINYLKTELDYRFQIVFPLVYSLDEWKKLLTKKMSECKSDTEFHNQKLFFKNCLKELTTILDSEYLTHSYIENSKENEIKNTLEYDEVIDDYVNVDNFWDLNKKSEGILISSGVSHINKMIEWIDESFLSIGNIKINKRFKFNDNIENSNKLVLSNNFNQNSLLKILVHYFESYDLEYDKESLESLVYHFTTIEVTDKKQGYNSKLIKFTRLKYVDFIPDDHTQNIIKIFLKLLHKGIIKTRLYKTFDIIELMFSKNNQVLGFSAGNVKKYWYNKRLIEENFKIYNHVFWDVFIAQLPKK